MTVPATRAPRGATSDEIEVRCPANARRAGAVANTSAEEVAVAAAALRRAQPEWEAIGPERRAAHLRNWLDWMLDNERRLQEIVQSESGKSWGDTSIETMVSVDVINYFAKHAAEFTADRDVRPHGPAAATKRLRVHMRPYPLVGMIFPWNYPLAMPMLDVPGALIAGAAVLTKPSEFTPLAWAEVVRGWREEIGAPAVLACVTGDGATGAAVVDQVDMVQFTGSTATGRRIGVRAAERLIPCSLELGGKDAAIILDDARLDRAVGATVWGGLFNSGQSCMAIERVYVEAGVYDDFVGALVEKASKVRTGMGETGVFTTDYGAMANEAQLRLVERHVKDAVSKGARVLTGGAAAADGLFFPPTVLVDVDHSMLCMREETFGPLLPVMRVADADEAVRLANDSHYGLGGAIFTEDAERAEQLSRRLETGAITVNNAMVNAFQFPLPMGGWKQSGLGARFGGAHGVHKYCREQAFVAERVSMKSELHWYPYSPQRGRIIGAMVRLLGARDWRRRLSGIRP